MVASILNLHTEDLTFGWWVPKHCDVLLNVVDEQGRSSLLLVYLDFNQELFIKESHARLRVEKVVRL